MDYISEIESMLSNIDDSDAKIISELLNLLKKKGELKWVELGPVHRAFLKSHFITKYKITPKDIYTMVARQSFPGIPPCIKIATSMRDMDALDEIFSYFHTYGTEKLEPVLWTIGYLTLDNYEQKKLTALAQIQNVKHFPCTPVEKPPILSKYCPGECPLKDPVFRLELMIEEISLTNGDYRLSANLTIKLKDGSVFQVRNMTFIPTNTTPFFTMVARQFSKWFSKTHHGVEYPDFIAMSEAELANFLRERVCRGVLNETNATSLREVSP